MRAKVSAAIAATVAVVALLAPATAAAGRQTGHAEVVEQLVLWGTNGYGFEIDLVNRQRLTISASARAGRGLFLTSYSLKAPQPAGSKGIKASLGKLGRIDVRFVPSSVKRQKPSHPVCNGEKTKIEYGHFVGLIEFRGEHGYTHVRATRAVGGVGVEPAPSCLHGGKHEPHERGPEKRPSAAGAARLLATMGAKSPEGEAHFLHLKVTTDSPRVKLDALQLLAPPGQGKKLAFGNFIASATRDRGRIKEQAAAMDFLVRGSYFKVPDLTHLTAETVVEPPAPFLGSATLRRESSKEVGWTGDLRVNLPGFGVVPLAGPGTHATLCADSGCKAKK